MRFPLLARSSLANNLCCLGFCFAFRFCLGPWLGFVLGIERFRCI
jgi:hypothetical protein